MVSGITSFHRTDKGSCYFFMIPKLIEFGQTGTIFTKPGLKETEDYITGRFG